MKISANMNLDQLAERMGGATDAEAEHMRALLDDLGVYSNTEDVPGDEWVKLCEEAAVAAQAEMD